MFHDDTRYGDCLAKRLRVKTKCDVCDLELPSPERLERHKKKAHSNVPEKKMDDAGGSPGEGGLW